jgi:hypothetical protein
VTEARRKILLIEDEEPTFNQLLLDACRRLDESGRREKDDRLGVGD